MLSHRLVLKINLLACSFNDGSLQERQGLTSCWRYAAYGSNLVLRKTFLAVRLCGISTLRNEWVLMLRDGTGTHSAWVSGIHRGIFTIFLAAAPIITASIIYWCTLISLATVSCEHWNNRLCTNIGEIWWRLHGSLLLTLVSSSPSSFRVRVRGSLPDLELSAAVQLATVSFNQGSIFSSR